MAVIEDVPIHVIGRSVQIPSLCANTIIMCKYHQLTLCYAKGRFFCSLMQRVQDYFSYRPIFIYTSAISGSLRKLYQQVVVLGVPPL